LEEPQTRRELTIARVKGIFLIGTSVTGFLEREGPAFVNAK
jgi:hypothetical protein